MTTNKIPRATAKRLPLYYRTLQNLQASGKLRVSSTEFSEAVKIDAATIRRDFSHFGALGRKGYGYNVEYLINFFRQTLEQGEETGVILVGVGNLGTALLHDNFQKSHSIKIKQAYDIAREKVDKQIGDVQIYHMDQLTKQHLQDIYIAILAVPAQVAQSTTHILIEAGVKGILNFTPARLDVPDNVRVHHIDLSIELQSLVYFLKQYPLDANK